MHHSSEEASVVLAAELFEEKTVAHYSGSQTDQLRLLVDVRQCSEAALKHCVGVFYCIEHRAVWRCPENCDLASLEPVFEQSDMMEADIGPW